MWSEPGTPDSPTPDIDFAFQYKQQLTALNSTDNMNQVRSIVDKLKFSCDSKCYHVSKSSTDKTCSINDKRDDIIDRITQAQSDIEKFQPQVIEMASNAATAANESLSDDVRKENLLHSMDWLRYELLAMKREDQTIAQQLISLRLEIQRLRLQHTIVSHQVSMWQSVIYELGQGSKFLLTVIYEY